MVGRRSGTNTRQGKRQGQAAKQLMRCPEFHGRVRTYSAGRDGVSAHFEHRENNPGCTLGYNFDGTRRRHRKPRRPSNRKSCPTRLVGLPPKWRKRRSVRLAGSVSAFVPMGTKSKADAARSAPTATNSSFELHQTGFRQAVAFSRRDVRKDETCGRTAERLR